MNMMNTSSRMTLQQALELEDKLPATCGRISSQGFQEGLIADLNHPLTGGRNAIFAGERFVPFNHADAPLYRPVGPGVALVRRGDVAFIDRTELGKDPFRVFSRASGERGLMYVDMNFIPGKGVKSLNHVFWSGTQYGSDTKYQVIERDRNELLVQFVGVMSVFYEDGSVYSVSYSKEDGLRFYNITPEQQAGIRVDHALSVIDASKKKQSVIQVRQGYEMLMQILMVGGRRWQSVRDRVISIFYKNFSDVSASMKLELIDFLGRYWREEAKPFEALLTPHMAEVVEQTTKSEEARAVPTMSKATPRPRFITVREGFVGLPDAMAQKKLEQQALERQQAEDEAAKKRAEREKKLADRRARDKLRREAMKGAAGGGQNKKGKVKK